MKFLVLKPAGVACGAALQKRSRALAAVALVALVASGCGDSARDDVDASSTDDAGVYRADTPSVDSPSGDGATNLDGNLNERDAGIDRADAPGTDSLSGDGSASPDGNPTDDEAGIDRADAPSADSPSGDGSANDGPMQDAASNDGGERDGSLQDQRTSDAALDGDACACSVIDGSRGVTSVPCFCGANPTLCKPYGEGIECPAGPLARPVILETYADCDYVNVRYDTGLYSCRIGPLAPARCAHSASKGGARARYGQEGTQLA